ncbi:MAG: 6-phosphogluconolactonase [Actinomycetota bacterium]
MAELLVTDDVVGVAMSEFLKAAPRVMALGGGITPKPLYERLSAIDYPWSDVDVLFTDERCVPPDHPDSNFGMVDRALLSRLDSPPRVHQMPGTCDADAHEVELRRAFGALRLDLAVLGLGADGHTASLFPGEPVLNERVRWVARVTRPDHARITLTLPALSSARLALFLVAGREKRDAVARLLAGEDIPAAGVRADRVLVVADPAASPPLPG